MRLLLAISLLFAVNVTLAQKYFTKTGITEFKASVEAFEPVEAVNKSTTAILNTTNGQVASLLFVKAFHFKVALMEEHFNENYMDSDKHPKATFKGNIVNFKMSDLSNKEKEYKIKGTLTIKGKSNPVETLAKLKLVDGKVVVDANFSVKPEDYGIEIPGIVRKKIAQSVKIILHYELVKKG